MVLATVSGCVINYIRDRKKVWAAKIPWDEGSVWPRNSDGDFFPPPLGSANLRPIFCEVRKGGVMMFMAFLLYVDGIKQDIAE